MTIAFDTAAQSSAASTSASFSHTITGTNPVLVVYVRGATSGGNTATAGTVTYNGVSMTLVQSIAAGSNCNAIYILQAPPTGAHTVAANFTSGGGTPAIEVTSVSYTGAAQTGQPDASNAGGDGGSNSYSASVTVVRSGSWVVAGSHNRGGSLSTSSTQRGSTQGSSTVFADTNTGVTGVGNVNFTGTSTVAEWVALSIAPPVTSQSGRFFLLFK